MGELFDTFYKFVGYTHIGLITEFPISEEEERTDRS